MPIMLPVVKQTVFICMKYINLIFGQRQRRWTNINPKYARPTGSSS